MEATVCSAEDPRGACLVSGEASCGAADLGRGEGAWDRLRADVCPWQLGGLWCVGEKGGLVGVQGSHWGGDRQSGKAGPKLRGINQEEEFRLAMK